jgi:amino acid transporter
LVLRKKVIIPVIFTYTGFGAGSSNAVLQQTRKKSLDFPNILTLTRKWDMLNSIGKYLFYLHGIFTI